MKIQVEIVGTIDVVANGERASLPYPRAGYGGHELVIFGVGSAACKPPESLRRSLPGRETPTDEADDVEPQGQLGLSFA